MKVIYCIMALLGITLQASAWNDTYNSIELTQLYIVGDAVPKGWDLGGAEAMHRIYEGVFEWTGHLLAGKEFKFMNTNDAWQRHIVGTEAGLYVDKDEVYPLRFHSTGSLPEELDMKFHVADTGDYTVYVDLNAMRMKITDVEVSAQWPDRFYITGSAIGGNVVEIPAAADVEHKIVLKLNPGAVRIMDTPAETPHTHYYRPLLEDVDIQFGKGYYASLYESVGEPVSGWNVTVGGDYALYLDRRSKTYCFQRYSPHKVLYLVGGCCQRAWNYWDEDNCRFYPSPDDPDVMVWKGELRIGWDKSNGNPPEPDKFKILTAQDWSMDTYHPYYADADAVGVSCARIMGGDDIKWTIDQDGYYCLELNTRTETLTGTLLDSYPIMAEPVDTEEVSATSMTFKGKTIYFNYQGIVVDDGFKGAVIAVSPSGCRKILKR